MTKEYYKILEINKNASQDEIKKAYQKMVVKRHPDRAFKCQKGKSNDECYDNFARTYCHPDCEKFKYTILEKFEEVLEAYKILSDPQKRKAYDKNETQNPTNDHNDDSSSGHPASESFKEEVVNDIYLKEANELKGRFASNKKLREFNDYFEKSLKEVKNKIKKIKTEEEIIKYLKKEKYKLSDYADCVIFEWEPSSSSSSRKSPKSNSSSSGSANSFTSSESHKEKPTTYRDKALFCDFCNYYVKTTDSCQTFEDSKTGKKFCSKGCGESFAYWEKIKKDNKDREDRKKKDKEIQLERDKKDKERLQQRKKSETEQNIINSTWEISADLNQTEFTNQTPKEMIKEDKQRVLNKLENHWLITNGSITREESKAVLGNWEDQINSCSSSDEIYSKYEKFNKTLLEYYENSKLLKLDKKHNVQALYNSTKKTEKYIEPINSFRVSYNYGWITVLIGGFFALLPFILLFLIIRWLWRSGSKN